VEELKKGTGIRVSVESGGRVRLLLNEFKAIKRKNIPLYFWQ